MFLAKTMNSNFVQYPVVPFFPYELSSSISVKNEGLSYIDIVTESSMLVKVTLTDI
jgi:hypothetical protein